MAGIGDLLGLAARAATQTALKNKNTINRVIGSAIGNSVANAANNLLEKANVQNEDGTLIIKLPFLKTVEEKTKEILEIHPNNMKSFVHLGNSISDGCTFYDMEGNASYHIVNSSNNLNHVSMFKSSELIGEVHKKAAVLKNPLQDIDKFSITLHGKELGLISVGNSFLNTYAKPEFSSWQMNDKGLHGYEILNSNETEIASIYYPGDSNYVFDYSESIDLEILILSFVAVQMRKERIRKTIERDRKISSITKPLKPWR